MLSKPTLCGYVPMKSVVIVSAVCAILFWSTLSQITHAQSGNWAFEESFNSDPAAPSQAALPNTFDYTVTHRIHPRDMLDAFPAFRADHGPDCAGPAPPVPAMHDVITTHFSSGDNPDKSFFICKNHMMSSMGDVSGYSVTSFWPRQEFDFSDGGVVEFDVNINENPGRFWWEVLIAPRDQLKPGSAEAHWPIDETYPEDRIRFSWLSTGERKIGVGTGQHAPQGWLVDETSWRTPRFVNPSDPAITDRRIRRRMRFSIENSMIHWDFELVDGSFDRYSVTVPGGLPFTRGLVLFKTHAYTPHKDDNFDFTTWHWDNIRFDGPTLAPYQAVESDGIAYLQANGNRPIGDSTQLTIDLSSVGSNPKLFGQIHSPLRGQVRLQINGNPAFTVHPLHYLEEDCRSSGWSSFIIDVPAGQLRAGVNTFNWIVGPRPGCAGFNWDGFTVKDMELQFDSINESTPTSTTLIAPEGTASGSPTYSWSAVSNATWYYLWVNDATGTPIKKWYDAASANCASGSGVCAVTPTTEVAGDVRWWVRTWNANGSGLWSSVLQFSVPPAQALLISPTGAGNGTAPAYVWNAVVGSSWYYLWVNDSTGNVVKNWITKDDAGCSSGTGTCSFNPDTAVNGSSRWWIRTWNRSGSGPWSAPMDFTP